MIAKVQFAEHQEAEEVWQLYKQGFLKAFSIGARPIEGSPPTPAEVKTRTELAACKWIWRKIEMTELSAVSVGANAEALSMAVAKGLAISDGLRRQLGVGGPPIEPELEAVPDLPPLVGRKFSEAHARLIRSIRQGSPSLLARRLVADEVDRLKGRV